MILRQRLPSPEPSKPSIAENSCPRFAIFSRRLFLWQLNLAHLEWVDGASTLGLGYTTFLLLFVLTLDSGVKGDDAAFQASIWSVARLVTIGAIIL